jgi:hypothetical protein
MVNGNGWPGQAVRYSVHLTRQNFIPFFPVGSSPVHLFGVLRITTGRTPVIFLTGHHGHKCLEGRVQRHEKDIRP